MKTLIDEAAKKTLAIVPSSQDLDQTKRKLAQASHGLLPIESATVANVKSKIKAIERQTRQEALIKNVPGIQILDTEPFTWRDENGLPRLLPFDVKFEGRVSISGQGFSNSFPECVRSFYDDVRLGLSRLTTPDRYLNTVVIIGAVCGLLAGLTLRLGLAESPGVWDTLLAAIGAGVVGCFVSGAGFAFVIDGNEKKIRFITAEFAGVIPEKTREKIASAREHFTSVFILAETPNLEIKTYEVPQRSLEGDPLVIGFLDDQFYLIDKFDTTTLEQRIADNYAALPNN